MLCTLKNRQQQTCRVILAYIVALNWICDFYFPSGLLFGRHGWSHQHSSCPRAGGPRPTSPHGSHDLLNMSEIHQPSFHTDRGTMHSLTSFSVHWLYLRTMEIKLTCLLLSVLLLVLNTFVAHRWLQQQLQCQSWAQLCVEFARWLPLTRVMLWWVKSSGGLWQGWQTALLHFWSALRSVDTSILNT